MLLIRLSLPLSQRAAQPGQAARRRRDARRGHRRRRRPTIAEDRTGRGRAAGGPFLLLSLDRPAVFPALAAGSISSAGGLQYFQLWHPFYLFYF